MNAQTPMNAAHLTEISDDGMVIIPETIRKAAGLVPGAPVWIGINDRGEAVVLSRIQAKRRGETPQQRHARIERALDQLNGAYATGQPTDLVMQELRGDEPR